MSGLDSIVNSLKQQELAIEPPYNESSCCQRQTRTISVKPYRELVATKPELATMKEEMTTVRANITTLRDNVVQIKEDIEVIAISVYMLRRQLNLLP